MEDKKICVNCNTEVGVDEKFCRKCGYSFIDESKLEEIKEEKKESTKAPIDGKKKLIIGLIIVIVACIVGYIGYTSHKKQQIKEYLTEAHAYMTEIEDTTTDISFVNDAWDITESGSWLYYGTVKSYARSMFSSNISDAEAAFKSIEAHYAALQEMNISDPAVQDLKTKVEDLHLAYETVYSMVILFEYGGNSAEISKLKKVTSEFETMIETVADKYSITIEDGEKIKVAH